MTDFSIFFNRHFEIKTDPEDIIREEAFRLRYQVYCLERGFADVGGHVDRRESDRYDRHSLHGIVRHRESGQSIATVRLVPGGGDGHDYRTFPIEQAYPNLLSDYGLGDSILPRATTAEISRFAVSRASHRRLPQLIGTEQSHTLARGGWTFNGRCYPLVTFGLFIALMRLSIRNGITHWIAVMEPSLLRLLGRFGIRFHTIGGLLDYHGSRQPCYGRVQDIRLGVRTREQHLFDLAEHDRWAASVNTMPGVAL
ncbi:PEP-CTERM/exosortase system-associated acyltransferase [Salinisphaera sp.]|uniref:PEP-CTERM/exosortase system-associated acyltransferase n=1 Tax=Salinisphaera sp. TaxID=1914330 RepID=UPI002D7878C7|nr:PEP-CTERM/exosortase system-associated acyltransferase [Salinisphaera sp.]HET7313386.1 PEP-CTERM/exosortase system-associated acyltransferase [Salinisphaera sp.]